MRKPSVAAGFARALLELAVRKGAPGAVLAERAGIDPAALENQDNRIPLAQYLSLLRVGKELCEDPALALHFGEAFDLSEISIVGLIGRACGTLAEAFEQLNRYARLAADVDLGSPGRLQSLPCPEGLWIVDTRNNPNVFPELTESSFARMVCTARRFGTPHFIKQVTFTHPEPAYRAEYDRIFQVPLTFASDRNAVLTDEAWLGHKAGDSSRYVFGILTTHAEALIAKLEHGELVKNQVENVLLPKLHTGEARMGTVARKLGVSRQTLFRRLKLEGTTFEKTLDELRHRMAVAYLRGQKVSVNEAAYLVGFSEPAAFSRACKRWTGKSPRAFRRGL